MAIDCIATVSPITSLNEKKTPIVFDSSVLQHEKDIPSQFLWPDNEKPSSNAPELPVPLIDIGGFLSSDPKASMEASNLVGEACEKHGFFLVINHGIDSKLIEEAHIFMDTFFGLPLIEKQKAQRMVGEHYGYASSFTGRFTTKLPWKETLSLRFTPREEDDEFSDTKIVQDYMIQKMGETFRDFGKVYQEYCESMNVLALGIMELLGLSLGVGRKHFKEFFQRNDSIMRLNYYPICQKPDLTLGTGPNCDPTSLTILHQDDVSGLQVCVDGEWCNVTPNSRAFVVNIGDTFMVSIGSHWPFFYLLTNKKIVAPPKGLINKESPRMYPDFTWESLLAFTQKHYRSDEHTLNAFSCWIQQKNSC
ncbi:hypothetical protein MKW94_013139 [Papaver nudicaule]|uniref:Fe2OG dioxygenase domain-containing protein n=1 Tax=Papaver nudicaule TaxID=74823 RepID=A0AA41SCH7_PAPNU|nr:hypothetical protein [Papaver nudicaule]